MRGAGDLLGPRQSGHISAVGFHLYTRLLAEAVKRVKGQGSRAKAQEPILALGPWPLGVVTSVDLPLAVSIPAEYVSDRDLRLRLYRRLANLTDEDDVLAMGAELADRFGPLPREVENLLYQLRVKVRAALAGVSAVASENGQIVLILPPRENGDYGELARNLGPGVRLSKNKIWLPPPKGDLRRTGVENEWRDLLLDVLARLAAQREAVT
jgi:transcription-repair coupling factor (superfamily II helicase)